jgi:hypothetical protein
MKSRKKILYIVVVMIVLSFVGGCIQNTEREPAPTEQSEISFQEYLWFENQGVLVIQMGLMLVGALAVVALLPAIGEENNY